MPSYAAPLREIDFALRIAGFDRVAALPGYEEATPDLVAAVLEEAGKFGDGAVAPLNADSDRVGCALADGVVTAPPGFKEVYAQFVDSGWNALSHDPEFGGQGLPFVLGTAVGEIWDSACIAFGLCPTLTGGAVELLALQGSDDQKARFLPKLISGEWTGTMCLTEPQAGSDLAAVRSKAVPDGDAYRISGQKIFISWGEHELAENIIHMVLARLPDAPEGTRGISLFIVPKFLEDGTRNDVVCASIEHKMGMHGSPTCTLSFGEQGGALGWMVGEPNRGLEYMFIMMNNARLNVGREGVAIAERAYQAARDYANERVQGRNAQGRPAKIVEHADVKRMLITMRAETEAQRALCYTAAAAIDVAHRATDEGERAMAQTMVEVLIPIVKAAGTETGMRVSDTAIQVYGGMGFVEETGVAQYFRDVRVTAIYEGTNGIQALDLAGRKTLRDKGAGAAALIALMREDARALAGVEPAISDTILSSIDQLAEGVAHILEYGRDPAALSALAVPYLQLFATVAGGWMMARQITAALNPRDGDDPAFLEARKAVARVYVDHVLTRAPAFLAILRAGPGSIVDAKEEWL